MGNLGALDWSIIGVYLVINLSLGWFLSKKVHSAKDYYLGDRSAPWWAIGISVIATYVSALSFLGGPAWAYGDGLAALAIHINYALVVFVCVVFFIPFFYNSGVASIYDYLERRFGLASRSVMGVVFLVTMALGAASIMTATSVVVSFATGMDTELAIVLMTALVVAYTIMGGMNAVIWTDVLQGIILIIGAIIILVALLGEVSPLSDALSFLDQNDKLNPINTSFDMSKASTIWAGVFAMTLYHITVYGANQFMAQRALAAKNIGDAKKSYLVMGFASFFIYFTFFLVGALLFAYYKGKPFDEPNAIILYFADSLAVPGLMGILAAAILSASMSTNSSALNSMATITVTDFYQMFFKKDGDTAHYLMASRIFTIIWGGLTIPLAISFANSKGSILEAITSAGAYLVGAKLAMFGLGFFSKHTTERGLLIGVFAGFVGMMIFAPVPPLVPIIDPIWASVGLDRPVIAWPWYVVIGGGINIVVSWTASVILDGFQADWHPYSVRGQIRDFHASGKPMMQNGWYVCPGKIEPIVWSLPAFFVFILIFLAWFGTLGGTN